jgi:hypothetical protein
LFFDEKQKLHSSSSTSFLFVRLSLGGGHQAVAVVAAAESVLRLVV